MCLLMPLAMIVTITLAILIFVQKASAEQTGTFKGMWIASGQRQPLDFVKVRTFGTLNPVLG